MLRFLSALCLSSNEQQPQEAYFPSDDVLARTVGQEMVPIYGPSLPAHHVAYEDDIYADAVSYNSYRVPNRFAWDEKSHTGFVAIETKVSPSYLTGLLQVLYHNLAFRRFVYAWPYADYMESHLKDPMRVSVIEKLDELDKMSVMTQLQRLFARLQLLSERMTKTGPLLRALGLGETHMALAKLEVEDFLTQLFARIDEECKGTELHGKLDSLVRFTERKVTRCKECSLEIVRSKQKAAWKIETMFISETQQETYVRDFGAGISNYLSHYEMDFDCHKCQRQTVCVVHKEIVEVPHLSFVSLNRFVFFPSLDRRSKVRRRIVFPTDFKLIDFLDVGDVELHRNDPAVTLSLPDERLNLTGMLVHSGPSDQGIHYAVIRPPSREKWFTFADVDIDEVYDVQRLMAAAYGTKTAMGEEDECAYLIVYQKPVPGERPQSYSDVPDYLQSLVREEHIGRVERKRKKNMDREMQRIEVIFNNEVKELRVHGSATMATVTDMAGALFGLDKTLRKGEYRLRKWDKHYQVPAESFGARPNATVTNCRFYANDMLMIETLSPTQLAFVEYDTGCMSVKVQLYDAAHNNFSVPHVITVQKRNDPLSALKRLLTLEFGIPVGEQRIFKEGSSTSADGASTIELLGDNEDLSYKLHVWEGVHLYLEHSDSPPSDASPCQMEVDRSKNRALLTYSFEGREETLTVDRRDKFYLFRHAIAARESMEMDRFKVFQVFATDVRAELKNEDQPLHELIPAAHSREPQAKVLVERVIPRTADKVHLLFFVVGSDRAKLEPLSAMPEEWKVETPVCDMKVHLAKQLGAARTEGKHLRLREVECGGELGNMLPESLPLKDAVDILYTNKSIAIELLPFPDLKKDKNVVVFTVLQSHGNWTFSAPVELALACGSSNDDLYAAVSKALKLDVSVVGLAKATGSISPLDVPQLDWNPKVPNFIRVSGVPQNTFDTAPFFLRDGDVLIARNNMEEMQDLTDEKKISLMKGLK